MPLFDLSSITPSTSLPNHCPRSTTTAAPPAAPATALKPCKLRHRRAILPATRPARAPHAPSHLHGTRPACRLPRHISRSGVGRARLSRREECLRAVLLPEGPRTERGLLLDSVGTSVVRVYKRNRFNRRAGTVMLLFGV